MTSIPNEIRARIEASCDLFLSDPAKSRENYERDLSLLGIEPSIDSILALFCGVLIGSFGVYEQQGSGRSDPKKILDSYMPLVERRASEMRQAMISDGMR